MSVWNVTNNTLRTNLWPVDKTLFSQDYVEYKRDKFLSQWEITVDLTVIYNCETIGIKYHKQYVIGWKYLNWISHNSRDRSSKYILDILWNYPFRVSFQYIWEILQKWSSSNLTFPILIWYKECRMCLDKQFVAPI